MIKILKIDVVSANTSFANGWFFIKIGNIDWDRMIARYLDLSLEEYRKILIKHGAVIIKTEDIYDEIEEDCYFRNKEDAEKCLIELEPIYVMAKLIK